MTGKGITLKRLVATGPAVKRAELNFDTGLNVVGYISQTGKSYVVECIDFMLGGTKPPRAIKQSKGYDTLWLEFTDATGNTYVLKRPLAGGRYSLFRRPFSDVSESTTSEHISIGKKAKFSVSSLILSLAGFSSVQIRSNLTTNESNSLSLRMISHFFIVDEISMIDDKSPIHSRHVFSQTKERSAFKFLLTGKDDSDREQVEKESPDDVAYRVRREVYDELIRELEAEVQQLRDSNQSDGISLQEIEQRLAATAVEVAEISERIRQHTKDRRAAWLELQTAESRLLVLSELLARFSLLRSHYTSDLKRLDFISEGEHYLGQLETIACPLCGAPLGEHSPEKCDGDDAALTLESVRDAFERESQKILTHVNDLESTVDVLQTEEKEVKNKAAQLEDRIKQIDDRLRDELAPMMSAAKSHVEELIKTRSSLLYLESLESRLAGLRAARAELGEASEVETDTTEAEETTAIEIDDQAVVDFCSMMRGLLERWKFLPTGRYLTFDTARFDFVVDGQARKNNGKGVRAIIHAAFNLALMRYCLANDLPHPRFVILDSPLTTLKEQRHNVQPEELDEVPGEVQAAFFEDLARTPASEQIIVIENKRPPSQVRDQINYTEFVGPADVGRSGFYP